MNESTDVYDGFARKVESPTGKLGVLLPGMGAGSSTLIAGVQLVNAGHSQPIGSVTQMSRIRLGKRDNPQYPVSYTHLRAHETLRYIVCRLGVVKK